MLIENEFVVQAPIERVWAHLLDVERVAPCMPGGQLTDVVDDRTWKGKTNLKVGPVSLSFAGTVRMQERDDDAHRVVLSAKGMEQRGKGAASADVESHLEETPEGTKVVMRTDLTISGAVAQYGRGMIQDISQRLTREFAECLEANLVAEGAGPQPTSSEAEAAPASPAASGPAGGDAAPPAVATPVAAGEPPDPAATAPAPPASQPARPQPARAAAPVQGLRLTLWALWRALVRLLRRLFGRKS